MKNPTASAIRRVLECPASLVLPQAPATGDDAIKGTENHDNIEAKLNAGEFDALPTCAKALAEGVAGIMAEPAYAIDIAKETARLIGIGVKRNYGALGPDEIALSTDAVFTYGHRDNGERIVTVADWKSRGRVEDVATNYQLAAAAVAVMKVMALSEVTIAIGYLDDGEIETHQFDRMDMAAFFSEMRTMLARVTAAKVTADAGKPPIVHAGSWCQYCPAMVHCPAQAKPLAVFLGEMSPLQDRIPTLSPERVGKAYDDLKNIEAMIKKIKEAIRLRVERERIPTSKGKVLGLVDARRRSIDGEAAIARLNSLGVPTAEFIKTTHYTTMKEMKK